jgi:hypothetical protein
VDLDVNGLLDISSAVASYDVNIDVKEADLYKLKFVDYDRNSKLETKARASLRGFDIDKMYGAISLDDTKYIDSRGSYFMDSLDIVLTENYFDTKDVSVNSDFFDVDLKGIVNFSTIANSFKNYVMNYFHVNKWSDKGVKLADNTQDFYVNMTLKDTETLSNCYLVSLQEITQKGNPIDWSLSFRELEGSWWVNIEESSVTFETIGEGEFYYLHDLQNIISSLIYCDIVWKKNSI